MCWRGERVEIRVEQSEREKGDGSASKPPKTTTPLLGKGWDRWDAREESCTFSASWRGRASGRHVFWISSLLPCCLQGCLVRVEKKKQRRKKVSLTFGRIYETLVGNSSLLKGRLIFMDQGQISGSTGSKTCSFSVLSSRSLGYLVSGENKTERGSWRFRWDLHAYEAFAGPSKSIERKVGFCEFGIEFYRFVAISSTAVTRGRKSLRSDSPPVLDFASALPWRLPRKGRD